MQKIDYKKQLKALYGPSAKDVVEVDVPPLNYLMIDGMGGPDGPGFQAAIAALFPLAYTLKFMIKKGPLAIDYGVMPLEGLWWADDMSTFIAGDKDKWLWTLMIMQPDLITAPLVDEAVAAVKKKQNPHALPQVRFARYDEGRCAQILHKGPFSEEGPTVARVHAFIASQGCALTKKHHEIYLSDIRRAVGAYVALCLFLNGKFKTVSTVVMVTQEGASDDTYREIEDQYHQGF